MKAGQEAIERGSDAIPDGELVRATLAGDPSAFAGLVRRYLRRALAVAVEYARTRADAEDVVQDTFRRVLEALPQYDTGREFGPWFFTILRNTARNAAQYERRREHAALTAEHATPLAGPLEDAHRRELRGRIAAAVARLPTMQQTCFRLCLVEGLTSAEAAQAVGIAESTVRVHVHHARRALQEPLAAWREEPR